MKKKKVKTPEQELKTIMKRTLIVSIFQLTISILTIIAFIIMCITGNLEKKYIRTLLLAIALLILGIIGIIDYIKSKKDYQK